MEHGQALDATRLEVRRLQEEFRQAAERRNPAELAEIVQGHDAVRQRVEQLWRSPQAEVLAFDKPPYAIPPEEVVKEGSFVPADVALKTIYCEESLDWPGALGLIERFVEAGEQARFFPSIPMKMNIFDRRVALIPLAEEEGTIEGAIVVHSSHLLEALLALWETFWERAFPLSLGEKPTQASPPGVIELSADQARLVALLLAGSTSAAIARQMNVGLSTVERRIKYLMSALGVKTRFQVGYELARRGHVTAATSAGDVI